MQHDINIHTFNYLKGLTAEKRELLTSDAATYRYQNNFFKFEKLEALDAKEIKELISEKYNKRNITAIVAGGPKSLKPGDVVQQAKNISP